MAGEKALARTRNRDRLGRQRRIVMMAVIVMGLSAPRAWSECPAPSSICLEYERATLVFVGDVRSVRQGSSKPRDLEPIHVSFRVVEGLKGEAAADLRFDLLPSTEDFTYGAGQRVLVYATRRGAQWSTVCSRTRAVTLDDAEVISARALRDSRPGGLVYGALPISVSAPDGSDRAPDATRREAAALVDVTTDNLGRFETHWLDPGRYMLMVRNAKRAVILQREISVAARSGCIPLIPGEKRLR